MNDDQLLRYSRQILLPGIDVAGQQRLLQSRVVVMGLGGLGSPVAIYLAAAGVGELILVDFDQVELTNLQRQIVHRSDTIGHPKVTSAQATLAALNPEIRITPIASRLSGSELLDQVAAADLVIDGTDNFAARFEINRACVLAAKPLIWGAAVRLEGQVSLYRPDQPECACYQCVYPHANFETDPCRELGILPPVAGIVGSIQATEGLKLLLGLPSTLAGGLLLIDAERMEFNRIALTRNPACPACGDPEQGER